MCGRPRISGLWGASLFMPTGQDTGSKSRERQVYNPTFIHRKTVLMNASAATGRDLTKNVFQVPMPAGPYMKPVMGVVFLALVAWGGPLIAATAGTGTQRHFSQKATPSAVSACLASGASPMARNMIGETPPACGGRPELQPWRGHRPDPGGYGSEPAGRIRLVRPLHQVARYKDDPAAVIAVLIDGGADPDAQDELGATPLHRAARYNPRPVMIAALIDAGVDPMHETNGAQHPCTEQHGTTLDR